MGRGLINSGGVVCGTDSLRMELEGSTGNSAVWEGGGYCVKSTIHTCIHAVNMQVHIQRHPRDLGAFPTPWKGEGGGGGGNRHSGVTSCHLWGTLSGVGLQCCVSRWCYEWCSHMLPAEELVEELGLLILIWTVTPRYPPGAV